jgi:hypothetical protein
MARFRSGVLKFGEEPAQHTAITDPRSRPPAGKHAASLDGRSLAAEDSGRRDGLERMHGCDACVDAIGG